MCFPPGPAGAHKVTNASEGPVRILMISTMPEVDVSYYPDSEKYGVWPGSGAKGSWSSRKARSTTTTASDEGGRRMNMHEPTPADAAAARELTERALARLADRRGILPAKPAVGPLPSLRA